MVYNKYPAIKEREFERVMYLLSCLKSHYLNLRNNQNISKVVNS